MTSTGGTEPSARTRFGAKEVIHPLPFGRTAVLGSTAMSFWPGLIFTGPKANFRTRVPSFMTFVVRTPCRGPLPFFAADACGTRTARLQTASSAAMDRTRER